MYGDRLFHEGIYMYVSTYVCICSVSVSGLEFYSKSFCESKCSIMRISLLRQNSFANRGILPSYILLENENYRTTEES